MSALFVARTAGCHIFTESRQVSLRKDWLLNNGAQRSASGLANDLRHVQSGGPRNDDDGCQVAGETWWEEWEFCGGLRVTNFNAYLIASKRWFVQLLSN
jgi:hypothetical protein